MKIVPILYHPYLTASEIDFHECSDRVWVPKHMFEHWMLHDQVGSVVVAKLENVPVCIYGPHSESRNTIYAPSWVCQELGVSMDPPDAATAEEDDYIVPIRCHLKSCTGLMVQPYSSEHLTCGGAPDEVLSRGFENYTCLRKGQTMTLMLETGESVVVDIVEAYGGEEKDPSDLSEEEKAFCIRGGDVGGLEISLDLLAPLDTPEPEPEPLHAPVPPVQEPEPVEAPTLPPPPMPSRQERAALAAAAALRRLQAPPS